MSTKNSKRKTIQQDKGISTRIAQKHSVNRQVRPKPDEMDYTSVTVSQRGRRALFQSDINAAMDQFYFALEHLIDSAGVPADQRKAFRAAVIASLDAAKQGLLVRRKKAHAFELPNGLSWPKEKYSEAVKSGRVKDIVEFLEDEQGWFPLIKAGLVSRAILRARDRSAENGITNYLRDGTRKLPPHLHIPTKSELIDKLAVVYQSHGDQPARVHQALQRRKDRAAML